MAVAFEKTHQCLHETASCNYQQTGYDKRGSDTIDGSDATRLRFQQVTENLGQLLLVVGMLLNLRFFLLPVIADDTF